MASARTELLAILRDIKKPCLIRTDGTVVPIVGRTTKFSLEEMQKEVGGYIQILTLPGNVEMVLDEEGKYKNYLPNAKATLLATLAGIAPDDVVVGTVLLKSKRD